MNIYQYRQDMMLSIRPSEFNLEDTLDCGQCFRAEKLGDGAFSLIAFGKRLIVSQTQEGVLFKDTTPEVFDRVWRGYFDLDADYNAMKQTLLLHPFLEKSIGFAGGIRILRQEPWEALCCFIISQNNNIPRIKGIVQRLCEGFGEKIEGAAYSFPSPSVLAALAEEDLSRIRAGFRAAYILDAAKKVQAGQVDLEAARKMAIENARKHLMQIKGVGPKVADCVLLYGLYRIEAFPVDVWIKKAQALYLKEPLPSEAAPYAGVAQQYIFHYIRKGLN